MFRAVEYDSGMIRQIVVSIVIGAVLLLVLMFAVQKAQAMNSGEREVVGCGPFNVYEYYTDADDDPMYWDVADADEGLVSIWWNSRCKKDDREKGKCWLSVDGANRVRARACDDWDACADEWLWFRRCEEPEEPEDWSMDNPADTPSCSGEIGNITHDHNGRAHSHSHRTCMDCQGSDEHHPNGVCG